MIALVLFACLASPGFAIPTSPALKGMHEHFNKINGEDRLIGEINEQELFPEYWNTNAQNLLLHKLSQPQNTNVAKNVIFFLGDGMSIPTLKATRVFWGQTHNETGEERELFFETFPYVGLSKTYCVDAQVPDSACTATAFLCGIKANDATIGVTASVGFEDCEGSLEEEFRVSSIARWSQLSGKRTGLVTTTRVTHATPAGVYAHTASRDWESDADGTPEMCEDIAEQLIHSETGKKLNVIMGGGRGKMLPNHMIDEEGFSGERYDGKNLIQEWQDLRNEEHYQYIWNRTSLINLSTDTDYVLGLFSSSHCPYHLDADAEDPSLEEMTEAAIRILSKGDDGYFLLVEGGRIDHAHHDTLAQKALDETLEFSKAIQKAYEMTNSEDTLIVVTSDHAHVFTTSGYPRRGNDIFGIAADGDDGVPIPTLSYANGPGYKPYIDGERHNIALDDTHDKDYMFPTMAPLWSETHGGDEVAIFATGPWSHLFTGSVQQNFIPHAMAFASCVGDGRKTCELKNV